MAIGQITKFPIETILEYATSGQHGLSPQLCGSIHQDLSDCDLNHPVSERGIRLTLDSVDASIGYENLGTGYPIFSTLVAPTAFYNTIDTTSDYITGFLCGNTLFLSGYGDNSVTGNLPSLSDFQTFSVQGGKYQYSNTIDASEIPNSGYLIDKINADDVIAKTFIKCLVPFEQNASTYTIGVSTTQWEDKELITTPFYAPNQQGLVDFSYSMSMSSEYFWMPIDGELRIYRKQGSPCSYGQIGISTFYDAVVWSPNYGYSAEYDKFVRYNLSNNTYSWRGEEQFPARSHIGLLEFNSNVYLAGGYSPDQTQTYTDIFKYITKNDTVHTLTRGDLTKPNSGVQSADNSSIKAMFFGGNDDTPVVFYNSVEYILFSNDTMNALNMGTLIEARTRAGSVSNSVHCWTGGGGKKYTDAPANINDIKTIERTDFSSDTVRHTAGELGTRKRHNYTFKTSVDGFYGPGRRFENSPGVGYNVNTLDKLNFSTEVITTTYSFLSVDTSLIQQWQTSVGVVILNSVQFINGSNNVLHNNTLHYYDFSTGVESIIGSVTENIGNTGNNAVSV